MSGKLIEFPVKGKGLNRKENTEVISNIFWEEFLESVTPKNNVKLFPTYLIKYKPCDVADGVVVSIEKVNPYFALEDGGSSCLFNWKEDEFTGGKVSDNCWFAVLCLFGEGEGTKEDIKEVYFAFEEELPEIAFNLAKKNELLIGFC